MPRPSAASRTVPGRSVTIADQLAAHRQEEQAQQADHRRQRGEHDDAGGQRRAGRRRVPAPGAPPGPGRWRRTPAIEIQAMTWTVISTTCIEDVRRQRRRRRWRRSCATARRSTIRCGPPRGGPVRRRTRRGRPAEGPRRPRCVGHAHLLPGSARRVLRQCRGRVRGHACRGMVPRPGTGGPCSDPAPSPVRCSPPRSSSAGSTSCVPRRRSPRPPRPSACPSPSRSGCRPTPRRWSRSTPACRSAPARCSCSGSSRGPPRSPSPPRWCRRRSPGTASGRPRATTRRAADHPLRQERRDARRPARRRARHRRPPVGVLAGARGPPGRPPTSLGDAAQTVADALTSAYHALPVTPAS